MYHLGYKTVVINDIALIDVSDPNYLKIPGFGVINKLDPEYTENTTLGVLAVLSSITLAVTGPKEVAIYWKNRRYIGEGLGNMSSTQNPFVFFVGTGETLEQAWIRFEDDFGTSELFTLSGTTFTAKNYAIEIINAYERDIPDVSDPMAGGAGFKYNRFGGTLLATGVPGTVGVGNGWQVEEEIRHSIGANVDPYAVKPHGSQVVELDSLYTIHDYTVQNMGVGHAIHENLAQRVADERVVNRPIKLRLYLKGTEDLDIVGIINRMPDPLSATEELAISDFVVAEKAAGNWGSYDEIQCFGLGGNNGLHGWLGIANASLANGSIIQSDGVVTNGIDNYVESNLFPNTLTKYQLLNAHVSIYAKTALTYSGDSGAYYGSWQQSVRDSLWDRVGLNEDFRINTRNQEIGFPSAASQHRLLQRTDTNVSALYVNGIQEKSSTVTPQSNLVTSQNIYIAVTNQGTDGVDNFAGGTFSFFSMGASLIDPAAQNTNVINLLTDIGAI